MRAWLAMTVWFAASPAIAGPLHIAPVPPDPLLPRWEVARYTPEADADGLPSYARLNGPTEAASAPSGLSIGPVHAEREMINGHARVHYRVEGLTMFGGDVGASLSRRGAMLTLHWASGN